MTGWHEQPMAAFDVETTGIDVETARIVTAAVVFIRPGQQTYHTTCLINPGIDIPAEATAVHGITTEHAREHGMSTPDALTQITGALNDACDSEWPVIAYNAAYDLSLLDRELRRHTNTTVAAALPRLFVIDPFIIDKAVDRYRKGSRKLTAACEHYRVSLDGAHDAAHDALAAARVAWRIANEHPEIATMTPPELYAAQVAWAREQADGLRHYFTRKGEHDKAATVDGTWPVRPYNPARATQETTT